MDKVKSVNTTWKYRCHGGRITLDELAGILEDAKREGVPGNANATIESDGAIGRAVKFYIYE